MVRDRELSVHLDGVLCGTLAQNTSGNLTFTYDEAYRSSPTATPLSLSMPLTAAVHRRRVAMPYFQGLLPDSEPALDAISRRYAVSSRNPFAMLEHVGLDVAGAVQITPHGAEAPDALLTRSRVRRVSSSEVATMLDHVVEEYADGAPYADAVGRFSLAGAQPKIALHQMDDGAWGVPEDATPTTHILKPVAESFRRIDVVEHLTLRAAELLGNEVARSRLTTIGKRHVFVSARYDRRRSATGSWSRRHQEDLCQALAVPPTKKYQHRDGGPGVADIAALIRSLPYESDRRDAGEAFYRALVFNVVAGCTDAHAKNYSILLEGRSVTLAPLYDLLTYAGYWDGVARINSAMSIAGEYSLRAISALDLIDEGRRLGIERDLAEEIVTSFREGIVGAFETARSEIADVGDGAREIADRVMAGLARLPLALSV